MTAYVTAGEGQLTTPYSAGEVSAMLSGVGVAPVMSGPRLLALDVGEAEPVGLSQVVVPTRERSPNSLARVSKSEK